MVKVSKARMTFVVINSTLLVLLSVVFLYPYLLVISASFTDEIMLISNGFSLIPEKLSVEAYRFIFEKDLPVLQSLWNSILVTVSATVLSTLVCMLYAFALQHKKTKGKKFFNVYLVITMLFSGGLVPYYLTVSYFFQDSLLAIIIPGAMAAWYTFLIRNYFYTIPVSLSEAAEMDGAREYRILFMIYMPLSKPVIATILLFCAVSNWNSYTGPMMFIESESKYTIQLTIQLLLDNIESIITPGVGEIIPTQSVKMASVILATLPIICIYPFLQKYFITGMILGGVKE